MHALLYRRTTCVGGLFLGGHLGIGIAPGGDFQTPADPAETFVRIGRGFRLTNHALCDGTARTAGHSERLGTFQNFRCDNGVRYGQCFAFQKDVLGSITTINHNGQAEPKRDAEHLMGGGIVCSRGTHMNQYRSEMSVMDKLSGTTELTGAMSAVIKQTYMLLAVAVFCAMAGGYVGATSETMVSFFSSRMGWIAAMVLLNVIPWVAMACRHNPALGVTALVADGFLSGIVLSPILWVASQYAPGMILAAFMVTGAVFLGITGYIMTTKRTFSAPKGLMIGLMISIMAAITLNMFMNIGFMGIVISAGIGIFGVFSLVFSTSTVLNSQDADSPIPGALMLFAGLFNVFVATLNILLRLFGGGGGGRRS